jgi:oxygen-dependent protoporphyrinogen oxidase
VTSRVQRQQVVVIGAGIAGLVVGWELARRGHRPLLLEAGDAVGGVLSAHRVGGLVLDAGAESFATARPSVGELIGELGLTPAVVAPNPVGAWIRHRAGSAPLPTGGLLGIPARPWAADVRRVLGPTGSARACLDLALPRTSAERAQGSLGALVRARMGRRVLERLVEPVAGGVYAADPDELEIRTVAPGLTEALGTRRSLSAAVRELRGNSPRPGSAVASLSGGMHTLAAALHSAIIEAGGSVRTTAAVTRVEAADSPSSGWTVTVAGGPSILAARLVMATPAPASATLLERAVGDLSELGVLQFSATDVLLCTLVVDDARLDLAPRGTGVLVSGAATGVRAKALTHATAKWAWLADAAGPGRHVLRLSYGRGDGTDLPAEIDLPGIALTDAGTLLGLDLPRSAVVDAAVVRWSSALPVPAPGHAARVAALRAALGPRGIEVVGSAISGTGLAAVVADARKAADRLRSTLEATKGTGGTGTAAIGAASPGVEPAGD